MRQLEQELETTREDLQSTIEELESSNEELKASNEEIMSMNEELQSANEELETSKEELQSLNEELNTVNGQLHEKVQELETANNDMSNLFNSTDIATVFLDPGFRIRRFTPATTRLFSLIASDVGRPLGDIVKRFTDDDLLHDAQLVLQELVPREKEVQTEGGRWHARRIVPYRTQDQRIDGVVITFVDITERKQAADAVVRRLAAIVDSSADAIFSKDLDGTIRTWNCAAEQLYGYGPQEAVGRSVRMLVPEDRAEEWRDVMSRLGRGEDVKQLETERVRKDGQRVAVALTISPMRDADGKLVSASTIARDITDRKRAEAALRASQERIAADLTAVTRLHQVSTRLVPVGDWTSLLLEIVDAAIALTAADMGNVQLLERTSGALKIVASRGFERPFLEFFQAIHEGQAACGTAMQRGERVVIEDVDTSPIFMGSPALDALQSAGVRAVQTTPLVSRSGRLVGMLSTHYRVPRLPADRDLSLLDLLARQAADWIERTQNEQELQLQGRVAANLGEGVLLVRAKDAIILYTNERFDLLFGYGPGELLGKHVSVLNAGTERERGETADRIIRALSANGVWQGDVQNVKKDGTPFWTYANVSTFEHAEYGTVWVNAQSNITERKQAEQALRESERRFRQLFERSLDAILVADDQGRYLMANEAACRLLGYSTDELLAMRVADLPVSQGVPAGELYRDYLTRGREIGEFSLVRPDGQKRVVEYAAVAVAPGQHLSILRDVTVRKQAEQALQDREARLRAILDSTTDAIITIDHQGIIQSVNPSTERMFAYTAAEMVGQSVNMLMASPHREAHDAHIARYLQTGVKHIIGTTREVPARRKDGSIFPAELAVNEIPQLKLFTGIHRDITERRRLERELVEVASQQQQQIGQDLHDTVSQELTALGIQAADLSETLRADPAQAAQLAEQIKKGLQRSQQELRILMRGLLPVSVDAEGLMVALSDLADQTRNVNKAACTFHCSEPVSVEDNLTATHLYLIAQEAVHNALKHARPRNIRINLEANDLLKLSIEDDGAGIADAHLAAAVSGGLGLRIMRNRAVIIGATLTIEPVQPTGTRVLCTVPRKNHGKKENLQANPDPDSR